MSGLQESRTGGDSRASIGTFSLTAEG